MRSRNPLKVRSSTRGEEWKRKEGGVGGCSLLWDQMLRMVKFGNLAFVLGGLEEQNWLAVEYHLNLLVKQIQVFNHYLSNHQRATDTHSLTERLVKTETVIHKFTKIPCSTEQYDSASDRGNISIQTGFGAEAINILVIFPTSEHKDSFTALIK